MMKTALVLRHIAFEDLGSFAPVLRDAGYRVQLIDAGVDPLPDVMAPDLLIILGGPIGVNDAELYPCMNDERTWLLPRLVSQRPTLGICLGAQLMAAALGSTVAPMPRKEIGFDPLTLTEAGRRGPLGLLGNTPVLHWHGEAFQLPSGAVHLAGTPQCPNQAFAIGANLLGLQFHPEAGHLPDLERWLIGHCGELAASGIAPTELRQQALAHGPALRAAGQAMLMAWLHDLRA